MQEQITTCGGIHPEKRKGRKSTFLFTAQLLGKWNLFQDFQRVQIYSIAHKKQKRITQERKHKRPSVPIPILLAFRFPHALTT